MRRWKSAPKRDVQFDSPVIVSHKPVLHSLPDVAATPPPSNPPSSSNASTNSSAKTPSRLSRALSRGRSGGEGNSQGERSSNRKMSANRRSSGEPISGPSCVGANTPVTFADLNHLADEASGQASSLERVDESARASRTISVSAHAPSFILGRFSRQRKGIVEAPGEGPSDAPTKGAPTRSRKLPGSSAADLSRVAEASGPGSGGPAALPSSQSAPALPSEGRSKAKAQEAPPEKSKLGMFGKMAFKAERKLVSGAVSSDMGKRALKNYLKPETFEIMDSLRIIMDSDTALPHGTGSRITTILLKIGSKIALLVQHKLLQPADFRQVIFAADSVSDAVVRKYDLHRGPPFRDTGDPDHARFVEKLREIDTTVVRLLTPYVSAKTTGSVTEIIGYFTPRCIDRILTDDSCKPHIAAIANRLRLM